MYNRERARNLALRPQTIMPNRKAFGSNHNPAMIAEIYAKLEELKASTQEQLRQIENLEKRVKDSILIVGGWDGILTSSAFNAFSPSDDGLRTLRPMSSARACAATARVDGELYVFGGGSEYAFLDTVELYNFGNNEWTVRTPMTTKRCRLAGGALNGQIYAVGGRNDVRCLSSMEMLDQSLGRWFPAPSMILQKYDHASVELNGAIYAVGGFNEVNILRSAERFDPREPSWSFIRSLNQRRRGHSLVVMDEKIYAIGGCDGGAMIPGVEIYEPRVDRWMAGLPMNQGRGYFSAALLNRAIYVIGGVEDLETRQIVDTVECYKEGQGWEATSLRAVGRSSFASAVFHREFI